MDKIGVLINWALVGIFLLTLSAFSSSRIVAKYKGIDGEFANFNNEYRYLAKTHGILLDNQINIGFSEIDQKRFNLKTGRVIGMCIYGATFREIEIDKEYWDNASETTRMVLIYHELTHCACGRDHDYNRKPYGDGTENKRDPKNINGYFKDGCPRSVMFPFILEDSCTLSHYDQYIDEMFDRCEAY
jgi:hypothetical protein